MTTGDAVDAPLAEWAYITPSRQDGMPESSIPFASDVEQTELATYWFRLNYRPVISTLSSRGGGYGSNGGGYGAGLGYATLGKPAKSWLVEEFADQILPSVLESVITGFDQEATQWEPITADRRDISSLLLAAETAFQNLQRITAGHNGGPPLGNAVAATVAAAPALEKGFDKAKAKSPDARAAKEQVQSAIVLLSMGLTALAKGFLMQAGSQIASAYHDELAAAGHHAMVSIAHLIAALHGAL